MAPHKNGCFANNQEDAMETWIDSKTAFKGAIISVRTGNVRLADGTIAQREVVDHPGGVAIVPVHGECIVLIRQYRIAIGREIIEIPAGKLEGGEEPALRARLELEEETGFRAGRLVSLGDIYATVGYSSEKIHMFAAYDLVAVGQNLEFDERIETVEIPIAATERMLIDNEIQDAKTIVGLQLLHYRMRARARS
jgi:ADP-ribose diphosphatase